MKLVELSKSLFLFICLSYYISSQFDLLCNIVQLLYLSFAMIKALLALLHIVYIFIYLCILCCMCNDDYFHIF
jgi:hypothetical protein